MKTIKSVKYHLKPTASQRADLYRMFGADRFIFNNLLGLIKDHHFGVYSKDQSKPKIPSEIDLINEITKLKKSYDWLYLYPNDYLQASAKNLYSAVKSFYRGGGYPKFKSKRTSKQSINMYAGNRARIKDNLLYIPNRKEPIKFTNHFSIPEDSDITNYTISKDSVGKYWLSVTYKFEVEDKELEELEPIGCDLGLKETLITSDGKFYPRIYTTKKYEKKLTQLQRRLSKKKKGSENRNKARIKVAKLHQKITNVRKHNNHYISRNLVNNYNFITLESLQVKNMIKNRKLSKAIADVAWYQLTSMIQYKQAENQGLFHRIDKWYPSSKTCSCCGYKKEKLLLSERDFLCERCGISIDRDINASINILQKGLLDFGYTESEVKELLRNNQELSKIKSAETKLRPFMAQVDETERRQNTKLYSCI